MLANWTEWLMMGGYAAFVWPGYAISIVILAWMVIEPLIRYKQYIKSLREDDTPY